MRSILPSPRGTWSAAALTILMLATFGALRWMEIPAGEFIDWVVGVLGFWWLLGVVTIPWNIYFGARDVQNEIVLSKGRDLMVEDVDAAYVNTTAQRSLLAALALHAASAAGFASLAYFGLSPVGWFAASAALALTVARPATRLYRHVVTTLSAIGQRTRFPRDDARTALEQLQATRAETRRLAALLDLSDEHSWAASTESSLADLRTRFSRLSVELEELREANDAAHRRLSREAEQSVQRLSEDSAFLGNVREILRFVKEA